MPTGRWDYSEYSQRNGTISALAELRIPLYAVGPATARALEELKDEVLHGCTIKGGEETGTGALLAALILNDYNEGYEGYARYWARDESEEKAHKKPLLFITGEKHRDVIPSTLQSAPLGRKIDVHEMVVYSTFEDPYFPSRLSAILEDTVSAPIRWCIVFSPQGSAKLLEKLGFIDPSTGYVHGAGHQCWQNRKTFVASIGPTTRDYLLNTFGFSVDVCAPKPSPEGVSKGVRDFMRNKPIVL